MSTRPHAGQARGFLIVGTSIISRVRRAHHRHYIGGLMVRTAHPTSQQSVYNNPSTPWKNRHQVYKVFIKKLIPACAAMMCGYCFAEEYGI
jgi:hypothetical protein